MAVRTGEILTFGGYDRTGGIEKAVARSAQGAYDLLAPSQRLAARHVFLRLTATSSDWSVTAGRSTKAELTEGMNPGEGGDVEAVLEAFAAARLLTLAADSVEISHEALLREWPLLRDTWLKETNDARIALTRLRNVTAEWAKNERDASYLYGGSLLQTAADAVARADADPARYPSVSRGERDFLHASDRSRRRTEHRRRAVIAGLLALTLAALTAAGIAALNAASTSRQHAIALSRLLAAESLGIDSSDPVIARRLAVAAWSVYPTDQASSALPDQHCETSGRYHGARPASMTGDRSWPLSWHQESGDGSPHQGEGRTRPGTVPSWRTRSKPI